MWHKYTHPCFWETKDKMISWFFSFSLKKKSVGSSIYFHDWWLISFYHWMIFHHLDVPLLIHSCLKDILVASKFWQLWTQLIQASMCRLLCECQGFSSFQYIRRSMIAGSYGKSIFSFIRNFLPKWLCYHQCAFLPPINRFG